MSRSCGRNRLARSAASPDRRKRLAGVERRDDVEIGSEETLRAQPAATPPDPLDAAAPFAAARWLRPGKVVAAGAGMGIDDPKRLPA